VVSEHLAEHNWRKNMIGSETLHIRFKRATWLAQQAHLHTCLIQHAGRFSVLRDRMLTARTAHVWLEHLAPSRGAEAAIASVCNGQCGAVDMLGNGTAYVADVCCPDQCLELLPGYNSEATRLPCTGRVEVRALHRAIFGLSRSNAW
jgi:hypothetical protein